MRTTIDQRVLVTLRRGPHTKGQLMELLGVSPGGLAAAIVRLRADGLVERCNGQWQLTQARPSVVA